MSHIMVYYGFRPISKLLLLLLSRKSHALAFDFPMLYTRLKTKAKTQFEISFPISYYTTLSKGLNTSKIGNNWSMAYRDIQLQNTDDRSEILFY